MITALLAAMAAAQPPPCPLASEGIFVEEGLDPRSRSADRARSYRIGLGEQRATLPQLLAHTGHAERARAIRHANVGRVALAAASLTLLAASATTGRHGRDAWRTAAAVTGGLGLALVLPLGQRARRLPAGELARIVDGHNRELLAIAIVRPSPPGTPPRSPPHPPPCR
ncbi:MAG: hypothetical protein KTR31_33445 [Myxococcales bacterium]|nr:hypothetical protein [Myxococcales bacterium]